MIWAFHLNSSALWKLEVAVWEIIFKLLKAVPERLVGFEVLRD